MRGRGALKSGRESAMRSKRNGGGEKFCILCPRERKERR